MSALTGALNLIALELYGSAYHTSGRLHYYEEGGYGFPLPVDRLDVAVGFDKTY